MTCTLVIKCMTTCQPQLLSKLIPQLLLVSLFILLYLLVVHQWVVVSRAIHFDCSGTAGLCRPAFTIGILKFNFNIPNNFKI